MTTHTSEAKPQTWPFKEASKILKNIGHSTPKKGYVLFATGYGPSGLPHIGTFGEVVRTVMVIRAFRQLAPKIPCQLFVFSDDMDGMRKVPSNIPAPETLEPYLGLPLTKVPDPTGQYDSYGALMNAKLRIFLDQFGFDYTFKSATELYQSGAYNTVIRQIAHHYDAIRRCIASELGEERSKQYSPFLPLCQKTGKVLLAEVINVDLQQDLLRYRSEEGHITETSILDGCCKLQWKVDWGMRWSAFAVDYEMHGKDLDSSAHLSSKVCKILGYTPPVLSRYEMFLDQDGKKISKSSGNGVSIKAWLRYAPIQTLALFMYHAPQRTHRIYLGIIPKVVDQYIDCLTGYTMQDEESRFNNPIYYFYQGDVPAIRSLGLTFGVILNLACACHPENREMLEGFVDHYLTTQRLTLSDDEKALLNQLIDGVLQYYLDEVAPHKTFYLPNPSEKLALSSLRDALKTGGVTLDSSTAIQKVVYDSYRLSPLAHQEGYSVKSWFLLLYRVLFGQETGPRMGTFIQIYGLENTVALIEKRLQS